MTTTIRAQTPTLLTKRYSLTNVSKVVNSLYIVHSLSLDRNWHFGSYAASTTNVLLMSNDDTNSWNTVATFNYKGDNTEIVKGVIEMADGEVCVATSSVTDFPSYIYKSTGWGTTLPQHQAATWTMVYAPRGGSFVDVWGFRQAGVGSNGVAVCSCYGGGQTQTTSDTTEATRPRYVHYTNNNGNSWSQIYDVMFTANVSGAQNVHIHTCMYQEAWDRIWITFGDGSNGQAVAGAGNCMVAYADRTSGTLGSWNYLPQPPILANTTAQFTSSYSTANNVYFIADNTMAFQMQPIVILPITGFRTFGNARLQQSPPSNSPYGKSIVKAGPGLPLIVGIAPDTAAGMNPQEYPELLCSPDEVNWYPLYKDMSPVSFHSGFYNAVTGPSLRGKIVAQYETGQLIGTLSGPA